jgi:hypothetical protein
VKDGLLATALKKEAELKLLVEANDKVYGIGKRPQSRANSRASAFIWSRPWNERKVKDYRE